MEKSKQPYISVILPVYNAMPFLKEAIESLMKQTYQDFMVFAIDNGSEDGSGEYLKKCQNDKLRYIKLDNPNLVATLNTGIEISSSPLIARMDADDIIHPKRFEKQLEFLENHPEVGLVGTQGNYISKDGKKKIRIYLPTTHNEIVNTMLKSNHAIIHPSILFRRDIVKKIGGYVETFFPCEDYEFFLRCGSVTKLANLNQRFYSLRIIEESIISQNISESIKKYYSISQLYGDQYGFAPSIQQKWLQKIDILAVTLYRNGIGDYLNKNKLTGIFLVSISALVNPLRFVNAIRKRIVKYINRIKV